MTDVSFVDLVVRMLVSLFVVLGLMFGAYWIIRKRQGFGAIGSLGPRRSSAGGSSTGLRSLLGLSARGGRDGRTGMGGSQRSAGNRRGLRVLGRVGVGRTTQVVAVQFAERVFLLAASDQAAPAVLAELDLTSWLAATETNDAIIDPSIRGSVVRDSIDPTAGPPKGLIDSLREATTRRG